VKGGDEMTENVMIDMIQQKPGSFSEVKKKKTYQNYDKSFADTIKEINTVKSDRREKSLPDNEKDQKLDNQELLDKLKKILSKNRDKAASELISLLQGGSLNRQQKIMLQNLLSKIEKSSTNLSEFKSLLQKNSADHTKNSGFPKKYFSENEVMDTKDLKKIASLLEDNKITLKEKQQSLLKNELDNFMEMVLNSSDKNSAEILNTETLELKIQKLISLFDKGKIDPNNLETLLKREDIELPVMQKLKSVSSKDTLFSDSLSESNFASPELANQLKQLLNDQNEKNSKHIKTANLIADNKGLFQSDNDSSLGKVFAAGNTESGSDKNFLDLENNNLFFGVDFEAGDRSSEVNNFSLRETNTGLKQAENTDLQSQIVEKFTGEYSADTKEMQIQLEPRSLGKIDISLGYDNEKLVGKMVVENELVRTQLENSLKQLKTDLVKQGINIEQFKVETAKNSPQQIERQNEFAFSDQETASGDGETGQNQEYEQRKFFQGQYYVHPRNERSNTVGDSVLLRHQEMINRAAFSSDKLNLLA